MTEHTKPIDTEQEDQLQNEEAADTEQADAGDTSIDQIRIDQKADRLSNPEGRTLN